MKNILKINNLCYKSIFKNINLNLMEKNFYILIGKNGCGKTTLVNAILGNIKYEGCIEFCGIPMNKQNSNKILSDIGVITDFSSLDKKSKNGFEILLKFLLNLGNNIDDSKQIIYKISNTFKLDDFIFKPISELTLCQEKILLLCLTIIHNPKLVIVDDTLELLSDNIKLMYLNYLSKMKNTTILFITNNSNYFSYATSLLFIINHQIEQINSKKYIEDKKYNQCNSSLPFVCNFSSKLCMYGVLKKPCFEFSELVEKIWDR